MQPTSVSSVVLPEPLGPLRAVTLPSSSLSDIPRSAFSLRFEQQCLQLPEILVSALQEFRTPRDLPFQLLTVLFLALGFTDATADVSQDGDDMGVSVVGQERSRGDLRPDPLALLVSQTKYGARHVHAIGLENFREDPLRSLCVVSVEPEGEVAPHDLILSVADEFLDRSADELDLTVARDLHHDVDQRVGERLVPRVALSHVGVRLMKRVDVSL